MAGDSFVARLCTLSISDMSFLNLGVQAVLPYSSCGRISDVYNVLRYVYEGRIIPRSLFTLFTFCSQ